MPIDFYYAYGSPPCRAVMLTASALGIELRLKEIDLFKNEQLSQEFLKINPDHCLPTIVDEDFVLWESRAIMIYLAEKYGKDDSFYPQDIKKRAIVNQRIFFDTSEVFTNFNINYIWLAGQQTRANSKEHNRMIDSIKKVDKYLEKDKYIAGDHLTLPDLGLLSTISTYTAVDFDFTDYPNITRWFEMMKKEIPNYDEIDGEQCKHLKTILTKKLQVRKVVN